MLKKLAMLTLGLVLCAPAFSYVVYERPYVKKVVVVRDRPVVVNRVVYVQPYRNYYHRYYYRPYYYRYYW